jgi:long-chain acyl-CoA synthetase
MLTHGNLIADSGAAVHLINISSLPPVQRDDIHISYLPLAHMFERVVQLWMYSSGARVGFFRGDVKLLTDDIKLLRPTIFPSVPRLLNRIYDKINNQVESSGFIKKTLFNWALASKEAELKQGIVRKDSIWDKIVFKKV